MRFVDITVLFLLVFVLVEKTPAVPDPCSRPDQSKRLILHVHEQQTLYFLDFFNSALARVAEFNRDALLSGVSCGNYDDLKKKVFYEFRSLGQVGVSFPLIPSFFCYRGSSPSTSW